MKSISAHGRFVLIAFALALCSCQHRIPPEYEYPTGWVTAEHPSASVRDLGGVVTDASRAQRQFVLVERMTSDFKTRLDARLTDEGGRFHFRWMPVGTYYLRFRYPGFNDFLIPVHVSPNADKRLLEVQLDVSN